MLPPMRRHCRSKHVGLTQQGIKVQVQDGGGERGALWTVWSKGLEEKFSLRELGTVPGHPGKPGGVAYPSTDGPWMWHTSRIKL